MNITYSVCNMLHTRRIHYVNLHSSKCENLVLSCVIILLRCAILTALLAHILCHFILLHVHHHNFTIRSCGRSFTGICVLVKRKCFHCHRPGAPQCKNCLCACFCSDECRKSEIGKEHNMLCEQVDVTNVAVEDEVLSLLD